MADPIPILKALARAPNIGNSILTKHNETIVTQVDGEVSEGKGEGSTQEESDTPDELDEATNRRLLKRIDMFILPTMFMINGLNYLDKVTLSFASIMNLLGPHTNLAATDGIGLTGVQFSWLGSLYYFGYMAWQWPTNRLMQRFSIVKYSAFNIFLWGLLCVFHVPVKNFAGIAVLRVLLGASEAAMIPGFALITARWYRREEQGLRTALWFSANGLFQLMGSIMSWGIARAVNEHGASLAPWRILFLATGLFTILAAIFFAIVVPDDAKHTWWLSKADRALAVLRTRENWQNPLHDRSWKMYQVKEAIMDPMTWAFCLTSVLITIPTGGITNFFAELVVGFGFSPQESLLYTAPAGAIGAIAILLNGYLSRKFGRQLLWGMIALFIAIIAITLVVALPRSKPWGRLVGYWVTPPCAAAFTALLSLLSSNVGGQTKKATVSAFFMISYCVGSIIGPQTFRQQDAPDYVPGIITVICCWSATLVVMGGIWWYYERQNAKKVRIRANPEYVKLENEFLDRTDMENPEFLYLV